MRKQRVVAGLIFLCLLGADRLAAQAGEALPVGQNLRDHPSQPADIILGIDRDGKYDVNATTSSADQLAQRLRAIYGARTSDKVIYLRAPGSLAWSTVLGAAELAAKSGACVAAFIVEQRPGTASLVRTDLSGSVNASMRKAIDVQLPDPVSPACRPIGNENRIVLEVPPGATYFLNKAAVPKPGLLKRLREAYDPRPDKILLVKGDSDVTFQDVISAMDIARGAGVYVLGLPSRDLRIAGVLPDIDLTRKLTNEDGYSGKVGADGRAAGTPVNVGADQVYFEFQVEKRVRALPGAVPVYPEELKASRLGGEALVSFVVDTTGKAEPGSFKVLRATHALFASAVSDALPQMRFVPAEIGGRKVRQLVQQPFIFAVTPR